MSKIPEERYMAADEQASRAWTLISEKNSWIASVQSKALAITNENASQRSKFRKFIQLADKINSAVAPHSQCSKGCSACCYIDVSLTAIEAEVIGAAIGVIPTVPKDTCTIESKNFDQYRGRHLGKPCTFLSENRCTIYDHRPLSCRTHTNLGDAFFCDTSIDPEMSHVHLIDLKGYFIPLMMMLIDSSVSDIREFFPDGLGESKS